VGLPGDAREHEAEHGVDRQHAKNGTRRPPQMAVEHEQGPEQPEDRTRSTHIEVAQLLLAKLSWVSGCAGGEDSRR